MDPLKGFREIFRKDWKLFLGVNVFYFGIVLIGALVALLYPEAQRGLLSAVSQGLTTGPMAPLGDAYGSGQVLKAAVMTFLFNFFVGTIAEITVPSLIFPPWALFMGLLRSFIWGLILVVPSGDLTFGRLLPHYGTLLLEGEAYVVAIFACLRQIGALVWPDRFGETSRLRAYLHAVVDNLKLLAVVAVILALAALYEAWEVIFFAGILK
jgi:hypothetical protein